MQQINLYLPEFRPQRNPLRLAHMLWAALALIVLLGFYSLYRDHQNSLLAAELAAQQQALQETQLRLQKVTLQLSPQKTLELDAQITQLQNELQHRQNILAIISQQDMGNAQGFSPQLTAMARQSLATISIESFSLQQGGNYVEFTGKTNKADQVPLYLQKLRDEPSFHAVRFGVLNLEREKTSPLGLDFQLQKPAADKREGKQ